MRPRVRACIVHVLSTIRPFVYIIPNIYNICCVKKRQVDLFEKVLVQSSFLQLYWTIELYYWAYRKQTSNTYSSFIHMKDVGIAFVIHIAETLAELIRFVDIIVGEN